LEVREHIAKGGVPLVAADVAARRDYGPLVDLFAECTIAVPSDRPSAEQVLLSLLKL